MPGARSKINRFHAVFTGFISPGPWGRTGNFPLSGVESQISGQDCNGMPGRCQPTGERPDFDGRSSLVKKGIVRLGHLQEAHRNVNFRRRSARLQAGCFNASEYLSPGERELQDVALGWRTILAASGKILWIFPARIILSR